MDFDNYAEEAESASTSTMEGCRAYHLGKARSSPITDSFKGDPLGKTGGSRLWEEEESFRRVGQRAAAGYDGLGRIKDSQLEMSIAVFYLCRIDSGWSSGCLGS